MQVWGACSDVTRTWPVNGCFTPAQRTVYQHVEEVHRACLARCVAGDTLSDVHALSVRMLQRALLDLGVHLQPHEYRQVYPHSVGHWLGWDTHDVASVGQVTQLQAGVILTIEPGVHPLPVSVDCIPASFILYLQCIPFCCACFNKAQQTCCALQAQFFAFQKGFEVA